MDRFANHRTQARNGRSRIPTLGRFRSPMAEHLNSFRFQVNIRSQAGWGELFLEVVENVGVSYFLKLVTRKMGRGSTPINADMKHPPDETGLWRASIA